MRVVRHFISLSLLSLLAACHQPTRSTATGGDGTPADTGRAVTDTARRITGIRGDVYKGPINPIVEEGKIDSAALPGALLFVQDRFGKLAGKVRSDSAGRFFIELEPGTHVVQPKPFPGTLFPLPPSQIRVYVPEGEVVYVHIMYDTGIR
jgi:hypothetical protein